jgi:hypothetical protein
VAEDQVDIKGLDETLRAFRRMPKEANKSLRERSLDLADLLARSAAQAGRASDAQSALVAQGVKSKKDRIPGVRAGGATRVGRNRAPLHKILFGAEFGANRLKQFRPHRGREGYWLFPTVRRESPRIEKEWEKVADDVVRDFLKDDVGRLFG